MFPFQIYRIKRNGAVQFGMVIENSEFASSDDDSDGEEKEMLVAGKNICFFPNHFLGYAALRTGFVCLSSPI